MKILNKLESVIFHTIGTNSNAYIERFNTKYKNSKYFSKIIISNKQIKILDNNKKEIDEFGSINTFNQFKKTLIAFGYVEEDIGRCKIINFDLYYSEITNYIFQYHSSRSVNIIRQSRIVTFLLHLNIINENNFEKINLRGIKSKAPNINQMKQEISVWEKNTSQSWKDISDICKKIHDYKFIKKGDKNE